MTALLLTRPQAQSQRFAAQAKARIGAIPVLISPVLRIVPQAPAVPLEGVAGVVLTSENGARALAEAADVAGLPAWCVGDRTAEAARLAGMQAVSAAGSADDLVALIRAEAPAGKLLFAHGAETRGRVAERLAEAGFDLASVVVYDQAPQPLSAEARALLASDRPVIVPLFSPRSAALLAAQARDAAAPLILVALSEAVAVAWTGAPPARLVVAERPDAAAILDAIAGICTSASS
ncbi:uroporphyrinogen-III synthase [Psychromarinibacter sp. C21-152]|uniref:Uroporphyrinogen-III synthase n=1 Tax=Psychromarinibacter sediminicola TaxID=3033385 RepID=A0AAE3NUJ5_9RHOB|nr:uroporphyrinogen-III synthase [Psychromarinibacter sediminicola]MDF0602351.1 uroporphyrinogen-III synthase [Psychromarinibacter sediminicola]